MCVVGPTGVVTITVGELRAAGPGPTPQPEVIADLTSSNDTPSVELLAINLPHIKLSIGRYRRVAQPTVTKEGNTYRIIGQAAVAETPTYKQFELEVTCP